jgi:hypothetical protein
MGHIPQDEPALKPDGCRYPRVEEDIQELQSVQQQE